MHRPHRRPATGKPDSTCLGTAGNTVTPSRHPWDLSDGVTKDARASRSLPPPPKPSRGQRRNLAPALCLLIPLLGVAGCGQDRLARIEAPEPEPRTGEVGAGHVPSDGWSWASPDPSVVSMHAGVFLDSQYSSGFYPITSRVQTQLKTAIAMALASDATDEREFARSARRNLDWVITERLTENGGLRWDETSPYYFEVHQCWYLIAAELVQQEYALESSLVETERRAWRFLTGTNPAGADFYERNAAQTGRYFAYRDLHEDGSFQTQAAFKGSYEVGSGLWAMALRQSSNWAEALDGQRTPRNHLAKVQQQCLLPPEQGGFFDAAMGTWVRSLLWDGANWVGWVRHDWKYAVAMEEGVLECILLTGDRTLEAAAHSDLEFILSRALPDGRIQSLPDEFGSFRYEFGSVLSALSLGAMVFRDTDPSLSTRCLDHGGRMYTYITNNVSPQVSEDDAMILLGLARYVLADEACRMPGRL